VRDLPEEAAREVIQKALTEISEIERLTDGERPDVGLAVLNAAAGKGPQPLDPRLLAVLARALDFCFWSEGGHGPLGRELYALWGLRKPVQERPSPERAAQVARLASCSRLSLDPKQGTITLGEGAALDLWGFAEGHAVDRAVEILRQGKAGNGFVRIGAIRRGFGPGPVGKGWPVALPLVSGQEEATGEVLLRDNSVAIASSADHPLSGSDTTGFPYINQRTGQPAQGVLMTAALTELALDAQGLAAGLMIAGPREGQLRLGSLRPRPSVLWFMGSGTGAPLQVGYRWSEVSRR
jgi:thiamine biosynthesis lipoprotein